MMIERRKVMFADIQRANMWKRISAYLFDVIMIFILLVGIAYLTSLITGYDNYAAAYEAVEQKYEDKYGIDFGITKGAYEAMSDEEKAELDPAGDYLDRLESAKKELGADQEAKYNYAMIMSLIILIVSISIILSFAIYEFAIPLFLKNGQTLGKKIFSIAVVRTDLVRVSGPIMFARAMLGKCTVELLLPLVMILSMGLMGTVCAALIILLSTVLMFFTKNRTPIHDALAHTMTVDYASQLIFNNEDELIAYKNKLHAEAVEKQER